MDVVISITTESLVDSVRSEFLGEGCSALFSKMAAMGAFLTPRKAKWDSHTDAASAITVYYYVSRLWFSDPSHVKQARQELLVLFYRRRNWGHLRVREASHRAVSSQRNAFAITTGTMGAKVWRTLLLTIQLWWARREPGHCPTPHLDLKCSHYVFETKTEFHNRQTDFCSKTHCCNGYGCLHCHWPLQRIRFWVKSLTWPWATSLSRHVAHFKDQGHTTWILALSLKLWALRVTSSPGPQRAYMPNGNCGLGPLQPWMSWHFELHHSLL
jgi:hypothetical protein